MSVFIFYANTKDPRWEIQNIKKLKYVFLDYSFETIILFLEKRAEAKLLAEYLN